MKHTYSQLGAAAICGIVFGFAMHKAELYRAPVVREQFLFNSWTLLKFSLAAAMTSIICITTMYAGKASHAAIEKIGQDNSLHGDIGLPSTIAGGWLLGAGMVMCGTTPGGVWAQLGAGSWGSLITILGGIVGAVTFGMFYNMMLARFTHIGVFAKRTVNQLFGVNHMMAAAALVAALCAGLIWTEAAHPFVNTKGAVPIVMETFTPKTLTSFWRSTRWHPAICGAIVGLLQVPLFVFLNKNLGSSASIMTLASNVAGPMISDRFSFFSRYRTGFDNWWQVFYMGAAALGSFLAYWTATIDTKYNVLTDVSPIQCFLGGFLMVMGARLANGCTSGHGITGIGHGSLRSIVAMLAMVVGGLCTMQLFRLGYRLPWNILGFRVPNPLPKAVY